MSLRGQPEGFQHSPSAKDHSNLALRYRSSSDAKFSHQRPSGKAPHTFKTPIATFHNRSKLINSLFYRKALSRVHASLTPEQ